MAGILRGDIYRVDLNLTIGSKQGEMCPVLIISGKKFNERSETVIAVAITSQPQRTGFPLISSCVTKVP